MLKVLFHILQLALSLPFHGCGINIVLILLVWWSHGPHLMVLVAFLRSTSNSPSLTLMLQNSSLFHTHKHTSHSILILHSSNCTTSRTRLQQRSQHSNSPTVLSPSHQRKTHLRVNSPCLPAAHVPYTSPPPSSLIAQAHLEPRGSALTSVVQRRSHYTCVLNAGFG